MTDRMDSSSTILDSSVRMVCQSSSFPSTLDDGPGGSGVAVMNDEADSSLMARVMGTSGRVVEADTRATGGTDGRVVGVDAEVMKASGRVAIVDCRETGAGGRVEGVTVTVFDPNSLFMMTAWFC